MKSILLSLFVATLCSGLFAEEKVEDISRKALVEAVKSGKVVLLDCNGTLK